MKKRFDGIIPAVFTPMNKDGSVNLDLITKLVDHYLSDQVEALYVCGSTGEGPLLTTEERIATAKAYIQATAGKIPVIVQVGHDSLAEACKLANHAQTAGADAMSAVPPSYFKIPSLNILVDIFSRLSDKN